MLFSNNTTHTNITTTPKESDAASKTSIMNPSWFERNLGIYIEREYFTFDTINYNQELMLEIKDKLFSDRWLGTFTIGSMTKEKNCIKINFSNHELNDTNEIMFITENYFVFTKYLNADNNTSYGSSLIYFPKTNTITELNSIAVTNINNDHTLKCYKKQGCVIEQGNFNPNIQKFTPLQIN